MFQSVGGLRKAVVRIVFAVCILPLLAVASRGDVPIGFYKKAKQLKQFPTDMKMYIVGVGRGVFYANVLLEVYGREKLFCMPPSLKLDEGIVLSLLDQEVRSPAHGKPWTDDASIEMVMAFAFKEKFPCK